MLVAAAALACPLPGAGTALHAQAPLRSASPLEAAHAAFANGRYDEAIRFYEEERRKGSRWSWLPDLIQTVEQRRRLGEIVPLDTHRIGVVFVTDLHTIRRDGRREHQSGVTQEQKAAWRVHLGVLRRVIEAFSDGGFTLAFEEVDAVATYPEGSELDPGYQDLLDLERYFLAHADSHDTYVTLSTTMGGWGRGGMQRYPFINGVFYGPSRGMIALNAQRHGFPELASYFFDVVERVAGIEPLRGYRDSVRHQFAGWRGETDFDYYRWHFRTTLAGGRWNRLNFRYRWRARSDRREAYQRITAAYASIPLEARQRARALVRDAQAAARSDSQRAIELYEQALALSPYDPEALRPLIGIYRSRRMDPERLAAYLDRNADTRVLTDITEVAPPVLSPVARGDEAFADGRYEDAMRCYEDARRRGMGGTFLAQLLEVLEERRRLGDIAPADTHRIGVIFVTDIHTIRRDGRRSHRLDVVDDQKPPWRIRLGVMRRLIEALSGGGWTLAFEEVDAVATEPEGSSLDPADPNHLDLERYFFEHAGAHDTYLALSNTISPALGLARTYPFVNGAIYGPPRGMFQVNPTNHDLLTLFHEFFHVIEHASAQIPVAHGYLDSLRRHFPGWRGSGEFDYFRWHFTTTLAGGDWGRLNYRHRSQPLPDRVAAYARVAAAYAGIPLEARQRSRALAQQARSQEPSDLPGAIELYERALALSPYAPEALPRLVEIYRNRPADRARWVEYGERLAVLRSVNRWYSDRETQGLGAVVGAWGPWQITPEGAAVEWNVSDALREAGTYEVTLLFTEGWNAVSIAWVALAVDGREVARDAHAGRSGTRTENNAYTVTLPVHRAGATYALRAHLTGLGGTDSNGLVLLRRH